MRRGVQVRELMRREGLSGEVVSVFHSGRTGMIHGDDGYEVSFNEESLVVGLAYGDLGIGLRVSYGIFFAAGAKIPTAINVRPASGSRAETTRDAENAVLERGGGFGVV
jgi:hypothetical protein